MYQVKFIRESYITENNIKYPYKQKQLVVNNELSKHIG